MMSEIVKYAFIYLQQRAPAPTQREHKRIMVDAVNVCAIVFRATSFEIVEQEVQQAWEHYIKLNTPFIEICQTYEDRTEASEKKNIAISLRRWDDAT